MNPVATLLAVLPSCQPMCSPTPPTFWNGREHTTTSPPTDLPDGDFRKILVDDNLRSRAVQIGEHWRSGPPAGSLRLPSPPAEVEVLWQSLAAYQADDVFAPLDDRADAPDWWVVCLELMMIADEASLGIGFAPNVFSAVVTGGYVLEDVVSGDVFRRVQRAPFSLSTAADDVVCVQAKSRTPSVGCTLRSFSHHLSLLPPRGQVRARWVEPIGGVSTADSEPLGLLLVPFPYRIVDGVFRSAGSHPDGHWGWFDVDQVWLPNNNDRTRCQAFVDFVLNLIARARAAGERVDGVVLPELALNFRQFLRLAGAVARDSHIDFLISGVSSDERNRPGNFAATVPFFLLGDERTELQSKAGSHWY